MHALHRLAIFHRFLDNNKFVGTIPSQFSKLTSLRFLGLQINLLTGSLPDLSDAKSIVTW
jgi:hypothetical protein